MNTNKYTVENDYQIFVSFIDKSVMEDSQALVPPDTHKLGHSWKSGGKNPEINAHRNIQKTLKVECGIKPVRAGQGQAIVDSWQIP